MPSVTELRREAEWRRCRGKGPTDLAACIYFITTYCKIRHPERGGILFELREAQRDTLALWLREKLTLALKARQIGFSTLAACMCLWLVLFHADKLIITLSKTEREAHKLLAKAKYAFERLPEWMRDRGPKLTADTLSKYEFDNGSAIEALPATDPARGESAYLIIVDEWAFFENPEKAWAAIEPATDIGGRVIALSTANGSGNLFHKMWVKATTSRGGRGSFRPIFYSWRAVPERDDAWYAAKRRTMLEWQLHQEYPTTPEEAFIKSGNPVFNTDDLNTIPTQDPRRGFIHVGERRVLSFRESPDAPLRVWELPESGSKYVIGADVAEGLEHGDYSSAHVINVATGLVAAKWHGHIDPDLFGSDVLGDLGRYYNSALIGVEVNNHGYTTCVALAAVYRNIYYRHSYDERTKKKSRKIGWRTQANTKPLAIDELARAVRGDEPELILLDDETIAELVTFVRDADGKMHGSPFDDQVMSLAIANQMLKHSFVREDEPELSDAYTLDWWARQGLEPATDEWVIGAHSVRGTVGAMQA